MFRDGAWIVRLLLRPCPCNLTCLCRVPGSCGSCSCPCSRNLFLEPRNLFLASGNLLPESQKLRLALGKLPLQPRNLSLELRNLFLAPGNLLPEFQKRRLALGNLPLEPRILPLES